MNCSSQNSNRKAEYNDPQATVHIAVDVSKLSLETLHPHRGGMQVPNQKPAILSWLRKMMKQSPDLLVVCEATGGYEKTLIHCCWEMQCPVTRVNPRWIRYFAKGQGILAKTDLLDAKVILAFAEKAEKRQILPVNPPPDFQEELRELVDRRESLRNMRQQETNRLEKQPRPSVARSLKALIKCLEKQIALIEAEIQALQDRHGELDASVKRLCQIPSIGRLSAWSLLGHMPELGTLSGNEAAALAGVAPYPDDSGKHSGKRVILHGRAAVRRTLYMCAVVCIRHNPILGAFYHRLKGAGKPSKVALTAVMRKLIILCNRALKEPDFQIA